MAGFNLQDTFNIVQGAVKDGTFDPVGMNYHEFNAPKFVGQTINTTNPQISTGIAGTTPASNVPAGATTGTPSAPATNSKASGWLDITFSQVAIVILGFVFVAVGLVMFTSGGSAVQAAKKLTPGI